MTKMQIVNGLTRTFNKSMFKVKKHSPEILLVGGALGFIGSAVLACIATTKVNGVIEEANEQLETIHHIIENPKEFEEETGEVYTEKQGQKALSMVYIKTGLELTKLYGPALVLGSASMFCIFKSHGILKDRNLALAAYAAAGEKAFKEYRNRVIERFGKELDRELRYNVKTKEIEEKVVNEKGEEETVKKTVEVIDPNDIDDFARIYDDGCLGWTKDPQTNLLFLKMVQAECTQKLKEDGYLTLNDVYERLGFPKNKWGQIVGWVYDKEGNIGDNFVDFGLTRYENDKVRDFINGRERSIVLDFNYDGNLLELMP